LQPRQTLLTGILYQDITIQISMFSQTVEYALRAIVWLAANEAVPQTTSQIAAATLVPGDYLAKVMQLLGRSGLATAQRGRGGGFLLARPAAWISVLEVVNAVEPIRRITKCPLGLQAHGMRLCALHWKLDSAMASIEEAFHETSLADILGDPSPSKPLCAIVEAPNVA
jgi:Rrf2 family transcriptional regulator, nitric oxide-sensitive transcriptional repressor